MNKWNNRKLTLDARILISKTFIFAMFTHIFNCVFLLPSQINMVQKLLNNFIWKGRSHVWLSVFGAKYSSGGMKMLCVRDVVHTLQVKWMR